jgi:hypothetical protein
VPDLRSAPPDGAVFVTGSGHNPATKLRRLRDGDVLENGDIVLIRDNMGKPPER